MPTSGSKTRSSSDSYSSRKGSQSPARELLGAAKAGNRVRELALQHGFHLAAISHARELDEARARQLDWLRAGRQGEMRWMTAERAVLSSDPKLLLDGARSVISVGLAYWNGPRKPTGANQGKVARYAWGADYHQIMGDMLRQLAADLDLEFGGLHQWCVDTGPAMDKAHAVAGGLGWYGKNTNVLAVRFGSWILLGEILTTLELEPDIPHADLPGCGSCRLCLQACPTGALGPEYSIDSRKCISYLTIEHRGPIPQELRSLIGDWIFGCDICQETCPPSMLPNLRERGARRTWSLEVRSVVGGNAEATVSAKGTSGVAGDLLRQESQRQSLDLLWLLSLTHADYVDAFRGTAIKRAKVWMLRRNAAVALGNVGGKEAVSPLANALHSDEHPVVRGHAAWALGRLGVRLRDDTIGETLVIAERREADSEVLTEIRLASDAMRQMTV